MIFFNNIYERCNVNFEHILSSYNKLIKYENFSTKYVPRRHYFNKMESLDIQRDKVCIMYFLRHFLEFSEDIFVRIPSACGFSKSQGVLGSL